MATRTIRSAASTISDRATISPRDRLAFALDVATLGEARALVALLREDVGVFKVGLELFTAAGPEAVKLVHDAGARCFLDLKLHDISETVARAVATAAAMGVAYLTVHAACGPRALERAADMAAPSKTQLLAITVLTSLDDGELRAIGLAGPTDDAAYRLAKLAVHAGLSGIVCSPLECAAMRKELGPAVRLVVPGVRPAGASTDDQRRVATPTDAIRAGADVLVVGRPIRDASDPRAAARAILDEISRA